MNRRRILTLNNENPGMKDYVNEFIRLGYKTYVEEFFNKINVDKIEQLVNQSFISSARKLAMKKLILRRYEAMCDEISQHK